MLRTFCCIERPSPLKHLQTAKWQRKFIVAFASRHVRSIALFFAVVCLTSSALGADEKPARTSFEGFAFSIPKGWTRAEPDRSKTAAILLLNGNDWRQADAMIKVDVGKPSVPSAETLAKSLAGKDGKVHSDPVSIDGTDGIKVETNSTDMSRPKLAIVVYRDHKVYLLMAAEKKGKRVSKALDQIVSSWRWKRD